MTPIYNQFVLDKTNSILNLSDYELSAWNLALDSIKKNPIAKEKEKWIKARNEIRVHISGTNPTKLIHTRRPCEGLDILNYRIANYEPTTQPVLQEALNAISIIWDKTSYSYEFDKLLNNYISENLFESYSYFGWFQNKMQPFIYEDAMGWIVAIPAGEDILDSGKPIKPYMRTVSCDSVVNVIYEGCDLALFVFNKQNKNDSKNSSLFNETLSNKNGIGEYIILTKGIFCEVYFDGDNIFPLKIYPHDFGFVPAIQCKGNWNTGKQMHESFFNMFIPEANEYIKLTSDHNATMVVTGYPPRIVQRVQCNGDRCVGGWINGLIGEDGIVCAVCKGKGSVLPSSPFAVYEAAEYNPSLQSDNGFNKDQDPIRYVERNTDILKYQSEELKECLARMRNSVYLYQIGQAQSGVAKEFDMFPKQMHTLKISQNSFGIVRFISLCFQKYIDINNVSIPIVIEPTIFQIKSEFEILQEYQVAKTSGLPDSRLQDLLIELVQKRYSGDPDKLEREIFLMHYDPFYINDFETKLTMLQSNLMSQKQFQYSQLKSNGLQRMIAKRDAEIQNFNGSGEAPENLTFGVTEYPELTIALNAEIDSLIGQPVISPFDTLLSPKPVLIEKYVA